MHGPQVGAKQVVEVIACLPKGVEGHRAKGGRTPEKQGEPGGKGHH